jgi:hypothetical protein
MTACQTDWAIDKQCPVCASLLPVHPAAGRPAVYCKESCKKKALRAKQKASRISFGVVKTSRNSKKSCKTALTPVSLPSLSLFSQPAPVIRSVDDLKAFFNGL